MRWPQRSRNIFTGPYTMAAQVGHDLVQCYAEPLIAAWSNGRMVVSDCYNGTAASSGRAIQDFGHLMFRSLRWLKGQRA